MLSVIVPVFNSEQTLNQCLNSIIMQSYKDIEIIVVDDGSTDNSKSIVDQYKNKYGKIIYIKLNENSGIGNARNIGLYNAKGDYITFVDSDDWVDSNLYHNAIKTIEEHNVEIVIYGMMNEYENSISSTERYTYKTNNIIDNDAALRLLCRTYSNDTYISPIVNHKIYKSNFLKKLNIKFDTHSFYYDDEFTFLLFLNKCKIVFLDEGYYHYYQKASSIMHTFSKRHIHDKISTFKNIYNYLIQNHLYTSYNKDFWSFFDKSIRTVFYTLFSVEPHVETQKKYVNYFIEEFCKEFNYKDYINYLDVARIKSLWLL